MKLALAGINDWIIDIHFGQWADSEVGSMAWGTDGLILFIFYVCAFFFVLLMGIMFYCMWVYRRRPGVPAQRSPSHNTPLEITWSVVPSLLLAVMFFWGFNAYMRAQMAPSYAEQIDLRASKWNWSMTYPTDIGASEYVVLGANQQVPVFYMPAETPVRLRMDSADVLHSFWVPDFRTKLDVMPNRFTPYNFTANAIDRTGEDPRVKVGQDKDGSEFYYRDHIIYCAEYCGDQHSEMLGVLRVVEPAYYVKWVNTPPYDVATPPAEVGELVWKAKCAVCHTVDGTTSTGPTWLNAWGYPREFSNAPALTQETLDNDIHEWDNYARESILIPGAKVRVGFSNAMPSFDGQLSPIEMRGVIAYMRSLSDRDPGSPIQGYEDLEGGYGESAEGDASGENAEGQEGGAAGETEEPPSEPRVTIEETDPPAEEGAPDPDGR